MDHDFWHRRWEANQIGFHERDANPMLVAHVGALPVARGGRVFLPLCGKTLDCGWLLSQGYRVAGAELSELAVGQLFDELGVTPQIAGAGSLRKYSSQDIDIFVGDVFALSAEALGAVDAVYDRAALVALPEEMRGRYARHLTAISGAAPQLLVTFAYDQSAMDGPPFSVPADEVRLHYRDAYAITELQSAEVEGGLKRRCPATETAWLLSPRP